MKHNSLKSEEFFLIRPWQKRPALLTYFLSAYGILLRYWWQANTGKPKKLHLRRGDIAEETVVWGWFFVL